MFCAGTTLYPAGTDFKFLFDYPETNLWHYFCICWMDISFAPYTATVSLWMFMDSVFCACMNWITVHSSSFVCLFSRVILFQLMLHHDCISCTGEDTSCPSVRPYTSVWQSNSLLWSFVFHRNKIENLAFWRTHVYKICSVQSVLLCWSSFVKHKQKKKKSYISGLCYEYV
jgi:hypothetical protein